MKVLFLLPPLLFLTVCSLAQAPLAAAAGPGLTVIKNQWHREFHNPALERDPNDELTESQTSDRLRREIEQANDIRRSQGRPTLDEPQPRMKTDPASNSMLSYVYELKLRNDSSKEISAVTWEYVFFTPDTGQEVGRRKFESKERIAGGKVRNLVMRSAIPPTGTFNAAQAASKSPEKYSEKIVIQSVEYSDGSKWSATSN